MLLAAAAEQRRQIDPAGHDEGADPWRATDLVRRQCDEIGADRPGLDRDLAGGLDRVAMEQRAMPLRDLSDLGHRLDDAGLVVGIHHRYQRRALIAREKPVERVEGDDSIGTDRDRFRRQEPHADQIVLDCRNEDPLATGAEQGEVVGLGAAADEDDALWICITEQSRHGLPGALDGLARRAAAAMHRGRIAPAAKRFRHGRGSLRPQRRRCVPVEIALDLRRSHQPVPAAAGLRKVSQWRRPLVPRTRRSQTSASDTELK